MTRIAVLALLLLFFTVPAMAKTLLIDRFPITQKIVALTLEDVEDPKSLEEIFKICQMEAISVTLFCPGQFMQKEKQSIERFLALGCEIGICGVKYQPWNELREEEIQREYQLAKAMLPRTAFKEINLLRPPYDYYAENVIHALSGPDKILVVRGKDIDNGMAPGNIINIKMNDKNAIKKLNGTITQLKLYNYQVKPVLNLFRKSGLTI